MPTMVPELGVVGDGLLDPPLVLAEGGAHRHGEDLGHVIRVHPGDRGADGVEGPGHRLGEEEDLAGPLDGTLPDIGGGDRKLRIQG